MVLPLGDAEKTEIVPVANYALIAANVAMYLFQLRAGPTFTTSFAATPFEITHNIDLPDLPELAQRGIRQGLIGVPTWLTLFTAMFLHGGPLHLAGNMLYLWIFGDNVEEVLGTVRYLLAYLACGVAGSLAQILANPDSPVPTLGASGAVAGVMGMYLAWFPRHRVRVLLLRVIVEVPALWVIGSWIAIQLVRGYESLGAESAAGGVAYLAHVGGAGAGLAVAWLYRERARARRRMRAPDRYSLG